MPNNETSSVGLYPKPGELFSYPELTERIERMFEGYAREAGKRSSPTLQSGLNSDRDRFSELRMPNIEDRIKHFSSDSAALARGNIAELYTEARFVRKSEE